MNQVVTDKELDQFYGRDKTNQTYADMVKVITQEVRKTDYRFLAVPYVRSGMRGDQIDAYELENVYSDYSQEPQCLKAMMDMVAKSDCPYVAEFRKQVAERFAYLHADLVDQFRGEA